MNTLKNRLLGALLIVSVMMSFTMMPAGIDSKAIPKNGEWIDAGMELINGKWYNVTQCVKSDVVRCVIGSKRYLRAAIDIQPLG